MKVQRKHYLLKDVEFVDKIKLFNFYSSKINLSQLYKIENKDKLIRRTFQKNIKNEYRIIIKYLHVIMDMGL